MKIATTILICTASLVAIQMLKYFAGVPPAITIAAFIIGWLMAGPDKD